MKKLLKTFLALTALLSVGTLSSCGNDNVQSAEETNVSVERQTKHVVGITYDNFSTYVDLKYTFYGTNSYSKDYFFIGAIANAFYDNVNFRYSYYKGGKKLTEFVSLSASGYAQLGETNIFKLTDFKFEQISGSVIYWL